MYTNTFKMYPSKHDGSAIVTNLAGVLFAIVHEDGSVWINNGNRSKQVEAKFEDIVKDFKQIAPMICITQANSDKGTRILLNVNTITGAQSHTSSSTGDTRHSIMCDFGDAHGADDVQIVESPHEVFRMIDEAIKEFNKATLNRLMEPLRVPTRSILLPADEEATDDELQD